jgi:hypothetical protein
MMENGRIWESLERYQDFIVNGLDLLSFLLVTPELLNLARPLIQGKAGIRILRFSVAIFTTYVTMFGGNAVRLYLLNDLSALNYAARFFPFLAGAAAAITFDSWKDKLLSAGLWEKFSNFLFSNLLFLGVVLFFFARMFAFAVASHRTFGIP